MQSDLITNEKFLCYSNRSYYATNSSKDEEIKSNVK